MKRVIIEIWDFIMRVADSGLMKFNVNGVERPRQCELLPVFIAMDKSKGNSWRDNETCV